MENPPSSRPLLRQNRIFFLPVHFTESPWGLQRYCLNLEKNFQFQLVPPHTALILTPKKKSTMRAPHPKTCIPRLASRIPRPAPRKAN